MSNSFWNRKLKQALQAAASKSEHPVRLAVIGIGNSLNGDDGAGVWVARRLVESVGFTETFLAIDAGPAPENFTGSLRRFQPDLVLLVDAAEMGSAPGTTVWLDWRQAGGFGGSTHSSSLALLAQFITSDLNCNVYLLCIQPSDNYDGESLSIPLETAVRDVVVGIEAAR